MTTREAWIVSAGILIVSYTPMLWRIARNLPRHRRWARDHRPHGCPGCGVEPCRFGIRGRR